ncbi:MAG: hypothetical protein OHK0029_28800 [Armatimonadaceae bacterium]
MTASPALVLDLRYPRSTLLFPVALTVSGLGFLLFGDTMGMKEMPPWAKWGLVLLPLLLGGAGLTYFLSFRLRSDSDTITQSSLFHRRAIRWDAVSGYSRDIQADGSGYTQGAPLIRLHAADNTENVAIPLTLEPASGCQRLLHELETRFGSPSAP